MPHSIFGARSRECVRGAGKEVQKWERAGDRFSGPARIFGVYMGSGGNSRSPKRMVDTALLLSVITFLDTFSVGLVNPIYPTLVQSQLLGATLYASILSFANAGGFACATLFGRLSDVRGRRAAIIASVCTTFCGFAFYAIGLACEDFSPMARQLLPAAGRILGGIGRSALNAPLLALVADHAVHDAGNSDTARQQKQMARTMATFGFGYASGSGVGGFLVGIGGVWFSMGMIGVSAALQVLCAILLPEPAKAVAVAIPDPAQAIAPPAAALPPTTAAPATTAAAPPPNTAAAPPTVHVAATKPAAANATGWVSAVRAGLSDRRICVLLLLQCLASASFHTYDATSAIYLKDALGYSASERGYLLSYAGWAFAAQTAFVVPQLLSRSQPAKLLALAFWSTAVGRVGLAVASVLPPTPLIIGSYAILNLGQGMNHTLLKALMSSLAGEERLGLLLGLLASTDR